MSKITHVVRETENGCNYIFFGLWLLDEIEKIPQQVVQPPRRGECLCPLPGATSKLYLKI